MTSLSRKPAEVAPPRLGALAKLPVFFDLAGKCAVVAGGSAAAAWKAELLAAAGADVAVYAEVCGAEMAALLVGGAAAGSVSHRGTCCGEAELRGAALAVADVESSEAAGVFVRAARAAGVPVNVTDRPAFCDFQFGSIVNRSPVVIGISTDGAAPILGQAIRRRIEALLPPGLADWAAAAKGIRTAVAARLSPGAPRRAFWEHFADWAFTRPTAPAPETLIEEAAAASTMPQGRVTLVGAGPGDAEHLTLKALRSLQSADVILFDDLVSPEVLELARREAKRMLVGKRGRRESCRQDDINDLMLRLALQGKHVVRLKSGDPMIFGRAGEEIERLEAAGVPVAVVPGITSASAMAARLGVSLTHRDHAQSVRFVTGHSRHGGLPEALDWHGLADPTTSLIVYMGGNTAGEFAARLLEAGASGDRPAVVATDISRKSETLRKMSLEHLSELDTRQLKNPMLIGIGAVFGKLKAGVPSREQEGALLKVHGGF